MAALSRKASPAGQAPAADQAPRRRLPPEQRKQAILEGAAEFFAEHGFGASTRGLAAHLGVTQALLYRYFPSKQALIDGVFERRPARRPRDLVERHLADESRLLEERLVGFYLDYAGRSSASGIRLFVRAGLEGRDLARRFSFPLTESVLGPIIAALRRAAGLPDFDRRSLMRGERELAMALHGAVMFINIRRHVYRMPLADDAETLIALQVRTYLPGAIAELKRLHAPAADPTLSVPLVETGRRRQ